MPTLRAILFDFDYTLADSTTAAVECINHALVQLGYPLASREAIRKCVGYPTPEVLARLTGVEDPAAADAFRIAFRNRADEVMVPLIALFDTVPRAIRAARMVGLRTAIVSNKQRFRIESILALHDAGSWFDAIIGGDDVYEPKPSGEGIDRALERLGLTADEVWYVGDHVVDAQAAEAAGVRFAAVLTGATRKEEFDALPVDVFLEDLREIAKLWRENGGSASDREPGSYT